MSREMVIFIEGKVSRGGNGQRKREGKEIFLITRKGGEGLSRVPLEGKVTGAWYIEGICEKERGLDADCREQKGRERGLRAEVSGDHVSIAPRGEGKEGGPSLTHAYLKRERGFA